MSTKNTILKAYDGRFKDIFEDIYQKLAPFFSSSFLPFLCEKEGEKGVNSNEENMSTTTHTNASFTSFPGTTSKHSKKRESGTSTA